MYLYGSTYVTVHLSPLRLRWCLSAAFGGRGSGFSGFTGLRSGTGSTSGAAIHHTSHGQNSSNVEYKKGVSRVPYRWGTWGQKQRLYDVGRSSWKRRCRLVKHEEAACGIKSAKFPYEPERANKTTALVDYQSSTIRSQATSPATHPAPTKSKLEQ